MESPPCSEESFSKISAISLESLAAWVRRPASQRRVTAER